MTFDKKMLVVPVDGSENSFKSLKYISFMLGPDHFSKLGILYIVSPPPPFLVEESRKDREMAKRLKILLESNQKFASEALLAAEGILRSKGFSEEQIVAVSLEKKVDIPRDICSWAENKKADAVVVGSVGRSKLEALFMGENACKVLERSREIPVWIVKGNVDKKPVMVCVDHSEKALKAVDHAGFILSGSDCPMVLFHTKRSLRRFFPQMVLEAASGLEDSWWALAGDDIAPVIEKAKQILLTAGVNASQLTSNIQEGTRNAASDILKAAQAVGAGTIVMGKCGAGGAESYAMGSVVRKVIEGAENTAIWVVP